MLRLPSERQETADVCWSKTASISQRSAAGSQDKDQGATMQLKVPEVSPTQADGFEGDSLQGALLTLDVAEVTAQKY